MVDVYVRDVSIESLLSEVVCEEAQQVKDAVVVPVSGAAQLIRRLLETPDESSLNERLFHFLNRRVPDSVLKPVLETFPELVARCGDAPSWQRLGYNERIKIRAKAHKLGLLSEQVRWDAAYTSARRPNSLAGHVISAQRRDSRLIQTSRVDESHCTDFGDPPHPALAEHRGVRGPSKS